MKRRGLRPLAVKWVARREMKRDEEISLILRANDDAMASENSHLVMR